jgi:magnesium-transporting ATPase (P-type)
MITGDHLETALKIAIDSEIITLEESRLDGIFLSG